jgi:hypothetical protein
MTTTELQQERRRLGPLRQISLEADSLAMAHGQLGKELREAICSTASRRLRATPPAEFARQIAAARTCRQRQEARIRSQLTLPVLRQGLEEYFRSLDAWATGSRLRSVLRGHTVDERPVTAEDLALWLQDDNVGCQTGMLRLAGGDVLFWHTEEDTIGYFDRPRLAAMTVGGQTWHAFLYPYLLPGPAFGWSRGGFHAVDSLHLRRSGHGTPTCIAAWLAWRFGSQALAGLIRLAPFSDGCAINRVEPTARGGSASVQELGWLDAPVRDLPRRTGSLLYQANCVARAKSRLGRREALTAAARERYCARGERTHEAIGELAANGRPTPQGILALLASRRGGSYAYANADVKAHCVGQAGPDRIEIYVQTGAALPGDVYEPQYFA